MSWYLTKIVYRIICGQGNHTAQFDEQLRLIEADSSQEAFEKATTLGQKEEDKFFNEEQKLVQWKFINVAELYKLSGLLDGADRAQLRRGELRQRRRSGEGARPVPNEKAGK